MFEMHLNQPGFTYSACGSFTKIKERIQKFKETGDTKYIYINELDKGCFQHDMTFADFKNLARRTASDKVLRDKVFNIAKNPKYDGYQSGIASMVYKFFDKNTFDGAIKSTPNEQLAEELQKPIIKKFKKGKYIHHLKTIFGAHLAGMQLISKSNKEVRYLLCIIDIFSKYAWVIPLKGKEGCNYC